MPSEEIDSYLAQIDEPGRRTLERLRASLLALIPDAEEGMSYGAPVFKVNGKAVAGFAAHQRHLTYLPHSGSVLDELSDELAEYEVSKGALRFPMDEPLPDDVVRKLVTARLRELGTG